jgi:WD40 repeat protein
MTAANTSPAPGVAPENAHAAKEFAHKAPLIACRFEPKGRFVFAASEDRSVIRWDLESSKSALFSGHDSWVFALGFSPDGQTLLTGGGDGRLAWWSAGGDASKPIRTIDAHHGWLRSIGVSPDGKLISTCGNDRVVRLWSFDTGAKLMELPGHDRPVYRVAFAPDGRSLVSADLRGVVIQWDHKPGKEARRIDAAKLWKYDGGQAVDYGGVRDFAFSPDGKRFVCGGLIEASNPLGAVSNPALLEFDWDTGKELLLQRPKEDVKGVAWGVRFHPAGFVVAVSGGTGGGFLWFWKPDQVHEFSKFKLANTGRDLDLHPDGLRLATAHHDGKLRITAITPKL